MKASFDIKSYSLESFCCALLLMFASFSVLPFSVAIVEEKEESESIKYEKKYLFSFFLA